MWFQGPCLCTVVHCRLFDNNSGDLKLARAPKLRSRTKHANLKHHHFRSFVRQSPISMHHIGTLEQPADIMTKPLGEEDFLRHCFALTGWQTVSFRQSCMKGCGIMGQSRLIQSLAPTCGIVALHLTPSASPVHNQDCLATMRHQAVMAVLDGNPMGLLSIHTMHCHTHETQVTGTGADAANRGPQHTCHSQSGTSI